VFWPVGLIVDRQPERRHELARAVGTIGLGAVALLGSALYSDYLPFIYVAMVVLGVFYEGLTSSSETLFADSVQELANEADSADAKAQISANWFTKKMAASYSGVALSPLLGVLCVLYFRRYVSPHVLLTRDQFAHEIGVPAVPDADSAEAATVNVYWNMGLLHFILLLGLILILPAVWRISGLKSIGRIKNKPASPSSGGALLSQDLSEPLVSKVPSPTTPGTTTTTSSSKVPYVIAVADFAQCIGAGMTFKYFNLFFIQDFGFGPTEICALQIVYPLCMVITVEFCNRVFLPLLKNSRAKVSMLCRLIAVLGLWLIGGAYPFQMVERDGSGSITSASSAEEASTSRSLLAGAAAARSSSSLTISTQSPAAGARSTSAAADVVSGGESSATELSGTVPPNIMNQYKDYVIPSTAVMFRDGKLPQSNIIVRGQAHDDGQSSAPGRSDSSGDRSMSILQINPFTCAGLLVEESAVRRKARGTRNKQFSSFGIFGVGSRRRKTKQELPAQRSQTAVDESLQRGRAAGDAGAPSIRAHAFDASGALSSVQLQEPPADGLEATRSASDRGSSSSPPLNVGPRSPLPPPSFFSMRTSAIASITYCEPAVLFIFLLTGSFAMATPGFDKSILMDHVATENRGKWNALLSFNGFAFRGSALFGGVLADGHFGDYRPAFTYAAGIYILSSLLYAPLVQLVKK